MKHRSSLQWGVRGIASAIIALLGYVAVTQSLAMTLRTRSVERAYRLSPGNALIAAEVSRQRLTPELLERPDTRVSDVERIAQAALRRDATAAVAVATLGLAAHARGNVKEARRLFAYGERLSRRDLPTQLWLIEDAVSRNRVDEALRHYDIALRTKRSAPDLLFPVLSNASTDPEIGEELVKTLKSRPAWGPAFLLYTAGRTTNAPATARLFIDLGRSKVGVAPPASASLVNALVGAGQFDAAWTYYATIRAGARKEYSRDPDFAAVPPSPSVLDWIPMVGDTGVSATIQSGEHGGVLDFSAPPTIGGQLLQQTQVLPPGRYVLKGRSISIEQPSGSEPYWTLKCRRDGRELGRVDVSNSSLNGGWFTGSFMVPDGCPAQDLILMARASDAMSGLVGQIDHVQLRPAA